MQKSRSRIGFVVSFFTLGIVCVPLAVAPSDLIVLSDQCPPAFVKSTGSQCRLAKSATLSISNSDRYQAKTTPQIRDGFTAQQIDLGRYLFFDPLLSADQTISCASCHIPELGFSNGQARARGVNGKTGRRSVPTLWNVGFAKRLFWDARSSSLEDQVTGPLFSRDEMANDPAELQARIQASKAYSELFKQAFPQQSQFTLAQLYTALTAFQSSLISLNSPFDQYAAGDAEALNAAQLSGFEVFRSPQTRCVECHTAPLFTNHGIAVIGAPEQAGQPFDNGAMDIFDNTKMRGGFKVPTLRNTALTAPYMHSGALPNLRSVLDFYNGGRGNAVSADLGLNIHWQIGEPNLSSEEINQLEDFLGALTDQSMMPDRPSNLPSGLPLTGSTEDTKKTD